MQEFYDYVYRISTIHTSDSMELDLVKEIKLFETEQSGYNGWPYDDNTKKVVTISPEKWGNVALINHRDDSNLREIMDGGAHLSAKSEVFKDEIDARIQMAFMAAKHGVKKSIIEKTTNGFVSVLAYDKLVDIFHEDFPEKFI